MPSYTVRSIKGQTTTIQANNHEDAIRRVLPNAVCTDVGLRAQEANVQVKGERKTKYYFVVSSQDTGLYKIKDPDAYANKLEEYVQVGKNHYVSFSEYLQGGCEVFASALRGFFGYDIWEMVDSETGKFVHAFCLVHRNNKVYYVDARGITTDVERFQEDYEDFVTYPEYRKRKKGYDLVNSDDVQAAMNFIKQVGKAVYYV